jgi:hypothetical protein
MSHLSSNSSIATPSRGAAHGGSSEPTAAPALRAVRHLEGKRFLPSARRMRSFSTANVTTSGPPSSNVLFAAAGCRERLCEIGGDVLPQIGWQPLRPHRGSHRRIPRQRDEAGEHCRRRARRRSSAKIVWSMPEPGDLVLPPPTSRGSRGESLLRSRRAERAHEDEALGARPRRPPRRGSRVPAP